MSRIKGRYVAQIVAEIDVDSRNVGRSVEEMRADIANGVLRRELEEYVQECFGDCASMTLEQLFADVYEVDE